MQFTFETLRKIYTHLSDDISKTIFLSRVNYSATSDARCIMDLPLKYKNLSADVAVCSQKIRNNKSKRLVVFGAGNYGQTFVLSFRRLNIFCFIDNYAHKTRDDITGLPVYSLSEYLDTFGLADTFFVICVATQEISRSIINQLLGAGAVEDMIGYFGGDWRNNFSQYFDCLCPRLNEAFVDCGCFDGSTSFRFAGWCGSFGYDKIWCFEPDAQSYENSRKTLKNLVNCEVFPYGVSNSRATLKFTGNGREDSRIISDSDSSNNAQIIETIALDDFLKEERITFIKMDVEGAEYSALQGAHRIIRQQRPRLAISVYHDFEHIVSIPELLLDLNPDYHFYLRHYSLLPNETILYAE